MPLEKKTSSRPKPVKLLLHNTDLKRSHDFGRNKNPMKTSKQTGQQTHAEAYNNIRFGMANLHLQGL